MLFLDGMLQQPGSGKDYTLSSSTMTMLTIPNVGTSLAACYLY
jgi:hypothetical protein